MAKNLSDPVNGRVATLDSQEQVTVAKAPRGDVWV